MNKILFALLIITNISLPITKAAADHEHLPKSQCGINALYSCLRFSGINLPLEQLYSEIQCNQAGQVNLYQLALYARRHGLHVKPVNNPNLKLLKKYLRNSSSAILQCRYTSGKDHIVALLKTQDDTWLFDFPVSKFVASEEFLESLFNDSRGMLLVSLAPFEKSIVGQLNSSRIIMSVLLVISLCIVVAIAISIVRKRSEDSQIKAIQNQD
ncbi:MAG TPA: cysteine peptidase family C39 domain-containing protein [Sedimentisphaerales bacterium]|nr:cysteine peptidase family C39 domain-containing protein [Sedimentisphaerales bacterium]